MFNCDLSCDMLRTFQDEASAPREGAQIAKTTLDFALGILIMANTNHSAPHLENRDHQAITVTGKRVRILSVEHAKIVTTTPSADLGRIGSRMFRHILKPDDEELWFPAHINADVASTMEGNGNHYVLEKASLRDNAVSICDSIGNTHRQTTQHLAAMLGIHLTPISMEQTFSRPVSMVQPQWSHTHANVVQQDNASDCGLCVICTASNELLGTPNTLDTVKQIRRVLPLIILALCHDKLQQTAGTHVRPATQSATSLPRVARGLLLHTVSSRMPACISSTAYGSNKDRLRAANRRVSKITRVAASFAKDPLRDILESEDLPDFTPLTAQGLKANRQRERGLTRTMESTVMSESSDSDSDPAMSESPDSDIRPAMSESSDSDTEAAQPLPPRAAHRVRDDTPGHPTGFMPTTWASCGLINGPFSLGKMDDPCRNCRALHFRSERREGDRNLPHGEATYAMCCKHGQI
jgi:hypothetical protein